VAAAMVAERDAVADAATFDLASHSIAELLVLYGRIAKELCDRGNTRKSNRQKLVKKPSGY